MKKSFFLLLFFVPFVFSAQMPGGNNAQMAKVMKEIKGRVYGKIVDASTQKPVEYASVVVLWHNKDSLLGGSLTAENGDFSIDNLPPMGGFRIKVTQIGYQTYTSKFYIQLPNKIEVDLGDIALKIDQKLLSEVDVVAEKAQVTMNIDKRVYNVDKDMSVRGGTAVDAMKNVPGVSVDADGNAQLRNQSPSIFVDGRPSNLTLQQIPADQIDRIEVITNPSVKYEAQATGGILNIILKKNLKPGYNGIAMGNVGTNDRYGAMLNLNVKEGKWNFSGMYNFNQAFNDTKGFTDRIQLNDSTNLATAYFNQDNAVRMKNMFNFGKLGVDYNLTNRDMVSFNAMLVAGEFDTEDNQDYNILDADQVERVYGFRQNEQFAKFQNYNGQLLYKKTYPKAGKELSADFNYNYTNSNNGYLFTTNDHPVDSVNSIPVSYQKNEGASNANQVVFQLDFVNPHSETKKFEAGIRSFYKTSVSSNDTYNATVTEENYTRDSIMSNRYVINDMVNAAYVNYNDKTIWNISYQAGLRFEQSYYEGIITDRNESFSYRYPSGSAEDIMKSLFPGIYLSKKTDKGHEWQLNFSRKIKRPNFFQLMPFVMFSDRQNIRIGNPELKPEFRNIAELNYNKVFEKGNYLGSVYMRYEEQPITNVAYPSLTSPNVLVNTFVNGENSVQYGTEHTIKHTFFKNLDAMLNVHGYYIYMKGLVVPTEPEVTAQGPAFDAKATLGYKFPKQLTLQVNGGYRSPQVLLLGNTLDMYYMDISLNKMIGTKWVLNATLSDVFNTKRMGTHYETPYYIQDMSRRREQRFFRFSVTYIFGKMDASIFKKGKQMRNQDNQQGGQDGLDFGK
ncbi:MAG: outer membrane beta-barrel protein [Bacteroidia bacterium]|nr:outer membrane beta-barrel protein [Bacteroidia bacterium]